MISNDVKKDEQRATPPTWIVAGLGNPGKEYVYTRHNAGFDALDCLADRKEMSITSLKFHSLVCEKMFSSQKVLFMKPQTFMNNSGIALREAASFYKIPPERILVICDDVSFDVGKLRIRRKGSDGGQKGVKSIIYHLQSDNFPRIKIGVGQKPHSDFDLASWVLSDIPPADRESFTDALSKACEACALIVCGDIEKAMMLYN